MTRKDYQHAVDVIHRSSKSNPEKAQLADVFIDFFKSDNPRFDSERFLAAVMRPFGGDL